MQTEIKIAPGGAVTIHVASLIYDLWDDFLYYRDLAEQTHRETERLVYKRHVRGAVLAYFAYFEGVLNSWITKLDPSLDLENESLGGKVRFVRRRINNNRKVPYLNFDRARKIRNAISHVKPTDKDAELMDELLDGHFFRDADDFSNWLSLASHALKLERHPDVPAILEKHRRTYIGNA